MVRSNHEQSYRVRALKLFPWICAHCGREFDGKKVSQLTVHHKAQALTSTSKSVAEVAGDVGYESEPSFNRAFKREFGVPPARFRSQSRSTERRT